MMAKKLKKIIIATIAIIMIGRAYLELRIVIHDYRDHADIRYVTEKKPNDQIYFHSCNVRVKILYLDIINKYLTVLKNTIMLNKIIQHLISL